MEPHQPGLNRNLRREGKAPAPIDLVPGSFRLSGTHGRIVHGRPADIRSLCNVHQPRFRPSDVRHVRSHRLVVGEPALVIGGADRQWVQGPTLAHRHAPWQFHARVIAAQVALHGGLAVVPVAHHGRLHGHRPSECGHIAVARTRLGHVPAAPCCAPRANEVTRLVPQIVVIVRARLGCELARIRRALRLMVVAFRIDRHDGLLVSLRTGLCIPGRMSGITEHQGKGART